MKKQIWYTLIIAFIISFFIDKPILNFFVNNRIEILNSTISLFTKGYIIIFMAIIFTFLIYLNKSKRKLIFPFWLSLLIAYLASALLKLVFMRIRPDVVSLIQISGYSFPSSHASVVSSVLPIFYLKFKKLKWLLLILGILVILSRLYVGVHYPSDLIGGTILGLLIGFAVLKKIKLS